MMKSKISWTFKHVFSCCEMIKNWSKVESFMNITQTCLFDKQRLVHSTFQSGVFPFYRTPRPVFWDSWRAESIRMASWPFPGLLCEWCHRLSSRIVVRGLTARWLWSSPLMTPRNSLTSVWRLTARTWRQTCWATRCCTLRSSHQQWTCWRGKKFHACSNLMPPHDVLNLAGITPLLLMGGKWKPSHHMISVKIDQINHGIWWKERVITFHQVSVCVETVYVVFAQHPEYLQGQPAHVHRCGLISQRDNLGSLQPEGQNVLEQITEAPAVSEAVSGAISVEQDGSRNVLVWLSPLMSMCLCRGGWINL